MLDRIALAPVYRIEAVFIIPLGIVLFLAGSRLLRAGALADDAADRRIRTRLMAVGFGGGRTAEPAHHLRRVIGAWTGICALFMTLSVWWLRRFDRGPLELPSHWAYQAPQRPAQRPVSHSAG